jgi:hypothetical protein
MRILISTAALVATALVAVAAPSASGAEPERRKAPKKCLWKKRDCHPPARLWYRVSVDLEAEQNESNDQPPTENFSGMTERHKLKERWTLRSKHAIRLTLLCDESTEFEQPFLAKRRIAGRRRTIGGCVSLRRAHGMRPTLRFAAAAGGEVISMVRTHTFGPAEVVQPGGGFRRCEGREVSRTLVSSQPLAATISAPDSATIGLLIDAQASAPFATTHNVWTGFTCEENGATTTTPQFEADLEFGHTEVIAGNPTEGVFALGSWFPVHRFINFSPRARKFGGDYIIRKKVTQPELKPGTFPQPTPETGVAASPVGKDYAYTIRLEACPDKGRDVQRC